MLAKRFFSLCAFTLIILSATAQTSKLNGVYAGAQLYNTPFNGMQIDHIVFYFKGDGTFNNELDKPDWRTKVSGNYTVTSNVVQISFKNGDKGKKYILNANSKLSSTAGISHTLHKLRKVTSIQAGAFEKKSASTSGGIGTGTPMVGAFSTNYLIVDGKGNFSLDKSSVVGVTGENIGGKFEKNGSKAGTYKIGDASLTLTFGDGSVTKHSFFYSPPNEEDLLLIDGDFYFRDDKVEKPAITRSKTTTDKTVSSGTAPTSATAVLNALRSKYGGQALDKITTIKETANMTGNLLVTAYTDVLRDRIRAEVRQNGKLVLIRQVSGDDGWQWLNGSKTALSVNDKAELLLSRHMGVLGLHQKFNGGFKTGVVTTSGNDRLVTFHVGKNKMVYLIGPDGSLKGNAYSINSGKPNISVYRNFTTEDGITFPGVTETSDGKSKLVSTTTAIEFDPVLREDIWATP